jgi:hypothetical protein
MAATGEARKADIVASAGRQDGGRLFVDFCGEEHAVDPSATLTFGRQADLVVDDNPYLHRVLGRFVRRGDAWWIDNVGRSIAITVVDGSGSSSATIGPGSSAAIVHGTFRCSFVAGPTRYELIGALEDVELEIDLCGDSPGLTTLEWGRVELNPDQRLLLTVLCEARLRDPTTRTVAIPPNRMNARRLGWSLAKFNRKLDHLCLKLSRHGLQGVHGDVGLLAANRRQIVVDHAIECGLVSVADLDLLDAA